METVYSTYMASLIQFSEGPMPEYHDPQSGLTREEEKILKDRSTTVYVGKFPFVNANAAKESHIYTIFSQCGTIKRVIMGINAKTKEPAGFCFVEFFERSAAVASVKWLKDTRIGGRDIAVDIDRGFEEGRQYGRGQSGFQRNDERQYGRSRNLDRDIGIQDIRRPRGRGRWR